MTRAALISIIERVVTTWMTVFFGAYATVLTSATSLSSLWNASVADKAASAAIAAAIMLLLSLVGVNIGDHNSASLVKRGLLVLYANRNNPPTDNTVG